MEDISNRIDCVRHVIKCIPNYEQLQALEVGCGIGDKSFFLSHDFAEYSVMEPNKIAYDVFINNSVKDIYYIKIFPLLLSKNDLNIKEKI